MNASFSESIELADHSDGGGMIAGGDDERQQHA
jgi:hypothetical protein